MISAVMFSMTAIRMPVDVEIERIFEFIYSNLCILPSQQMQSVRKMARIGSPRLSVFWNGRRKGTTSACSKNNGDLENEPNGKMEYKPSAEIA